MMVMTIVMPNCMRLTNMTQLWRRTMLAQHSAFESVAQPSRKAAAKCTEKSV